MPLFLHLVARSDVLHAGTPDGALAPGIFFDANNMFSGNKCPLVSLSLPQAKQPHQLASNLALCRYIDTDHHATTCCTFEASQFASCIQQPLRLGWRGNPMQLVRSPDPAALTHTQNFQPPTANQCCTVAMKSQKDFTTPCVLRHHSGSLQH